MHRNPIVLWDDTFEDLTGATAHSRRSLFRGAAGGTALAASGLLLPAWLIEDVAAGNHPLRRVQDRKERRRGKARHKKHHGRHRQREKKRKQNSQKRDIGLRGIQFEITVKGGPLPVQFYLLDGVHGLRLVDTRTVEPGEPIALNTLETFAAVWIDNRYYLDAVNYLPPLDMQQTVGLWGKIDPKRGWIDGSIFFKDDLSETDRKIDESAPIMWDDLRYVHFLRRSDGPLYKDFSIFIQPR
jgi:hypothetical protein